MPEPRGHRDPRLDDAEATELGELLTHLGVDEREAKILAFLGHRGEGRSAEIEQVCNLRQPQVSQATTTLEERGWIQTSTEKTPGKGRPVNVYSLALGLAEIVEEVTARRREEINKDLARIERAHRLVDVDPKGPGTEASPARHERSQGQG